MVSGRLELEELSPRSSRRGVPHDAAVGSAVGGPSDSVEELDERRVHLGRSFLLQPVAGAREHLDALQARNRAGSAASASGVLPAIRSSSPPR